MQFWTYILNLIFEAIAEFFHSPCVSILLGMLLHIQYISVMFLTRSVEKAEVQSSTPRSRRLTPSELLKEDCIKRSIAHGDAT